MMRRSERGRKKSKDDEVHDLTEDALHTVQGVKWMNWRYEEPTKGVLEKRKEPTIGQRMEYREAYERYIKVAYAPREKTKVIAERIRAGIEKANPKYKNLDAMSNTMKYRIVTEFVKTEKGRRIIDEIFKESP